MRSWSPCGGWGPGSNGRIFNGLPGHSPARAAAVGTGPEIVIDLHIRRFFGGSGTPFKLGQRRVKESSCVLKRSRSASRCGKTAESISRDTRALLTGTSVNYNTADQSDSTPSRGKYWYRPILRFTATVVMTVRDCRWGDEHLPDRRARSPLSDTLATFVLRQPAPNALSDAPGQGTGAAGLKGSR